MLSRVAESLFWTARSIERAENTSRLFDVSFHGLLDARVHDPEQEWRDLLHAIGRDELFREHFSEYTPRAVTEFLLWHPANPDSVTACVARARENLRGVREQISSEMWEHLNRLHLLVARTRHARGASPFGSSSTMNFTPRRSMNDFTLDADSPKFTATTATRGARRSWSFCIDGIS